MASKSLESLKEIWKYISYRNKLLLFSVSLLSIITASLETLVVVSFVPFINAITKSPEESINFQYNSILSFLLGEEEYSLNYLILFTSLIIISALFRLAFLYFASMNAARIGSSLSRECFKIILRRPYIEQVNKDSSTAIDAITTNVARSIKVFISVQILFSSIFLSCAIIYALISISWKSTFIIIISLFACYYIIYSFSKDYLYENGKFQHVATVKIVSIIKESLDSIREIIIGNLHSNYIIKFGEIDKKLRRTQAMASFIGQYPRFIIEALTLITLSNVAFFLSKTEPSSELLPLIAVISLGFIRLLPAIQQIYTHISRIKNFSPSIELLSKYLAEGYSGHIKSRKNFVPKKENNKLPILSLKNISFKYPLATSNAFSNFTYDIVQGSKTAIIGKSGSGKSTLQDLMLGLLHPDRGQVLYFGENLSDESIRRFFHDNISHVPQFPIIINSSIKNNITFLSEQNSDKRLIECIDNVLLSDFVKKNGLNYNCGEEGCNLSGGQRQRISLARALYSNKDILFLDECTSAIDSKSEQYIINKILDLYKNKTVISITHKLYSLALYDEVINIDKLNKEEDNSER